MSSNVFAQLQYKPLADAPATVEIERQLEWYRLIHLGRLLDDKARNYLRQAKGWSYHASHAGHDGIQVAMGLAFRQNKDYLFPYYRDMLTCLAAGITPYEIILNGLSKAGDLASGGRHMSNHFAKISIGIWNVSSATGNHTQHAAGLARAIKYYDAGSIVFSSQGESSCSEGYVFEALNGASREQLPVIFVVQNNGYGISVPVSEQTANPIVSENYRGLRNLTVINCDGTNPFDATKAMRKATDLIHGGAGPVLVHSFCERINAHSNSDRHEAYRSEEELTEVRTYDPYERLRLHLLNVEEVQEATLARIEDENRSLGRRGGGEGRSLARPGPGDRLALRASRRVCRSAGRDRSRTRRVKQSLCAKRSTRRSSMSSVATRTLFCGARMWLRKIRAASLTSRKGCSRSSGLGASSTRRSPRIISSGRRTVSRASAMTSGW